MQAIEKYFFAEKQAFLYSLTRRKTFLLHGLGGMGTTQLAVAFARRHQQRFSAILWLDGSSIDQLKSSLAAVASRIP
jgi:adenylylsulfate kinase-like enzyme